MIVQQEKFASDSSRWYDPKTQESVNDCLAKNGNTKKVTLREARKEGYVPSVTTILHSLAKPALERWKLKETLKVAARDEFNLVPDVDEWVEKVMRVANEEMDVARDRGQEIHGKVDRWLEEGMPEPQCAHTKAARNALEEIGVYGDHFEYERTFAVQIGDIWVSGKSDLIFPGFRTHPLERPDRCRIVDWKSTKALCDGTEKLGWDEHAIQLSCYSQALFGTFVDCYNVFLSTTNDGAFEVVHWSVDELKRGWEMYKASYRLWTLSKNYLVT